MGKRGMMGYRLNTASVRRRRGACVPPRAGGFTLIEFLIAVSILSIIVAVSYTSFVSVRKTMTVGRRSLEVVRELRSFLERLDVEMSGALYVQGDEGTLFRSKRSEFGRQKASSLIFTTIMPQSFLETGKRGDVIRVEYEVSQNPNDEDLLILTKKLYMLSQPPREFDEPIEFIVGEEFSSFLFRFKRGAQWFETWDTETRNELPDSVELVFSLGGRRYRETFNVYISEM
jgi:type II secretion system protein J